MGVGETLTAVAAWGGLALGAASLAVTLRARPGRPPPPAPPRVEVSLSSLRHARHGPASTLAAVLDVQNLGSGPVRVHVAEAEVDAFVSGAAGLRRGRATSRVPLQLALAPGAHERVPVSFEFADALVPDGEVPVDVRVLHERGTVEASAVSTS